MPLSYGGRPSLANRAADIESVASPKAVSMPGVSDALCPNCARP
jgi:hypothetical protein